ncbi:uncharacterized protein [Onthophagus taurus]|uniref:uncharacterized protein n=1 Tax=Onthophagus taurus TaxID=166361 RepID=UPI0039BE1DA4
MDVDCLIGEVFVRSPLWDQKNKNHHNRFVLDKLWHEVAVKLSTTPTAVRNKWKSLRDKFRTTLASIPKPESGDPQINCYRGEWKHFKSLLFLKDQFTTRKSKGNFPKNDENIFNESSQLIQHEINEYEQAVEDIIQSPQEDLEHLDSAASSVTPTSSQPSSSARNCPKKRIANEDIGQALLLVKKQKLEFLEQNRNKNEDDEDLNFFKSLLPHVRTFSAYDKLEYRMRIMKLTQEFVKPSENT